MAVRPQYVMRFYGNTDYAMQAIGFREITFLHPDKLNDPFDPPLAFSTDFSENYAALIDWIERCHKENLQNFTDYLPQENWDRFVDMRVHDFNSIRNNTFLFSTCEVREGRHPKDNLYMWSHYGNGHRGVAIEFDTHLLEQAVLAKSKKLAGEETHTGDVWGEINYTPKLPKITCESIFQFVMSAYETTNELASEETELSKIIKRMVRSKSVEWKREYEWRLMWLNDETKLKTQRLDLLDGTITAVYLGCLVADHLRDSFVSETKRNFPDAKVFMGKKAKGNFALVFEPLS